MFYLINTAGTVVASYTYDPYGKVLSATGSLASINPLRYRGYYYDSETGFYYLQSRYYDPQICRFINADSYASTGQDFIGHNMFAYSGNNPVNRIDPTGHFWDEIWEFAKTAVSEIGKAIEGLSPAYIGCGGAAVADGPLPIGDILCAAGVVILTASAIGYGIYQAVYAPPFSVQKAEEKVEEIEITAEPPGPVFFPVNPNDFYPVGLVKVSRTGTKNGAFISWMDPLTNTEVFRWDENPNYANGPHYHILGAGHYYPGDQVPEPFATQFFPFR